MAVNQVTDQSPGVWLGSSLYSTPLALSRPFSHNLGDKLGRTTNQHEAKGSGENGGRSERDAKRALKRDVQVEQEN